MELLLIILAAGSLVWLLVWAATGAKDKGAKETKATNASAATRKDMPTDDMQH